MRVLPPRKNCNPQLLAIVVHISSCIYRLACIFVRISLCIYRRAYIVERTSSCVQRRAYIVVRISSCVYRRAYIVMRTSSCGSSIKSGKLLSKGHEMYALHLSIEACWRFSTRSHFLAQTTTRTIVQYNESVVVTIRVVCVEQR